MLNLLNVTKSYDGKTNVIENIDLEICESEIFGIIGPNGAGKTTLLNTIMNRLDFQGDITINSLSNKEFLEQHREKILYAKDQPMIYDYLTGIEYIRFILDMRKVQYDCIKKQIDVLLNLFDMSDFQDHLIHDYSLGMKRKVYLIPLLVQKPKILILDEPVSGLDSKSIIILKRILQSLVRKKSVVIFSTHVLDLVSNLCDRIGILHDKEITVFDNIIDLERDELERIYLEHIDANIEDSIEEFVQLDT